MRGDFSSIHNAQYIKTLLHALNVFFLRNIPLPSRVLLMRTPPSCLSFEMFDKKQQTKLIILQNLYAVTCFALCLNFAPNIFKKKNFSVLHKTSLDITIVFPEFCYTTSEMTSVIAVLCMSLSQFIRCDSRFCCVVGCML